MRVFLAEIVNKGVVLKLVMVGVSRTGLYGTAPSHQSPGITADPGPGAWASGITVDSGARLVIAFPHASSAPAPAIVEPGMTLKKALSKSAPCP